jgi:hypothetical protein
VPEVGEIDIDRESITSVVWATGYQYDYGWLRAGVIDAEGRPVQQRGVTAIPGLYFLGLHWMHTIKSGCCQAWAAMRHSSLTGSINAFTQPEPRLPTNLRDAPRSATCARSRLRTGAG